MKLNVKRTVTIGFGFMTIMMLWQVYNWYVPKFLNDFLEGTLQLDKLVVGIIMALDNLFALFMIPLMSKLSDKTTSRFGRRMPYITVGIILSAVSFIFLPLTKSVSIWLFIVNVLLVLVCMNIYRSPCVALMPDITPKALRSKGNSVINIMGGVGTATGFILVFFFSGNEFLPFLVTAIVMLLCLAVLLIKVREIKFVEEYRELLKANGISEEDDRQEEQEVGKKKKTDMRNVWLVLGVVFLVYMANNAVETFISLYAEEVFAGASVVLFGKSFSVDVLTVVPFGVGTFACAVPAAILADKIGRKKTVLIGACLMVLAYAGMIPFVSFNWLMLLFFLIGGCGFGLIIVNIYPMVVDNTDGSSTGKYTGFYYTASMLAQSVTPALSGLFASSLLFGTMRVLFPYALVFMAIAIVIICLIRNDKEDASSEPDVE